MRLFKSKSERKNGQGIVLINGFSTSYNDFVALYPHLDEYKYVELIHFPSDTDDKNQKIDIKFDLWIRNIVTRIEEIQKEVDYLVLIGFSTGAIPACFFADKLKVDKLVLISPVFNYQNFDQGVEKVVYSIRSNIVNRFNPLHTIKSLKNVGEFLKNPIKNWKSLTKVNLTPITSPQTILLFPVFSFFEDEIKKLDTTIAKFSEWAIDNKNDDDIFFKETTAISAQEVILAKNSENKIFNSMIKQVSKILPAEFKELTSQNVINILQLLSYCDRKFSNIECPTIIYLGLNDHALKDVDIKRITSRISNTLCKVISYPTEEHNLFGSIYSESICQEVVEFISKPKPPSRWSKFKFKRKN